VAFQKELPAEVFERAASLTQESSVVVNGIVRADPRAPGGYELGITNIEIIQLVQDYPIALKEHGVEFLMANRHLWIRTKRQHAILMVRVEVIRAIRDWLDSHGS
jgi:asparaginyl-tRNA synthetase